MFKSRWVAAAVATGVVGLGLAFAAWTARTTAAPAPEAEQTNFRGKVLLVRSSFGMETHILEQVRVRQFGPQSFLLGKVVDSAGLGRDSLKGKTVWLNMNQVTHMVECEDAAAAKKLLKDFPQHGGYGPVVVPAPEAGATTPAPALPPASGP